MRCSLFGKLAAKRDFIALFAPRDFLTAWEPWMQSCMSTSRDALGDAWQQTYLTAPIWQFWLGADICGASVIGAFMSSLDGVGRYYPLTLFAYANSGAAIAPPDIDTYDEWFSTAEDFLLSTLDNASSYDLITSDLDRLPAPVHQSIGPGRETMSVLTEGAIACPLGDTPYAALFALLREANYSSIYAAASFWWTVGGGDFQPLALCCKRMPDPLLFTTMLTGRVSSDRLG